MPSTINSSIQWTETTRVLNEFAQNIVDTYKDKIQEYSSGTLYNSITFKTSITGKGLKITINLADYWQYIEDGRRKYPWKKGQRAPIEKRPPIKAIKDWIKVRNILPEPRTLPNGKTVIPTTKSLPYMIAWGITRKGIKPRPYMKQSIEENMDAFLRDLSIAVETDIANSIIESTVERI